MKDLLLIQSVKIHDVFDKVDAHNGLSYIQPSVDVVKTVMVQMRDVLLDSVHLSEIEANMPSNDTINESDDDEASIDARNKGTKTSFGKKKVISEPLRPLSIRNLGKVPLSNVVKCRSHEVKKRPRMKGSIIALLSLYQAVKRDLLTMNQTIRLNICN